MAKKETKNKVPSKRWEAYDIKGDTLTRVKKFCPKCGDGFFMAEHKNRFTCGKCGYSEFKTRDAKPEDAKPEATETKE